MNCGKCDNPPVIELQHGAVCKSHFLNYFEDKVFKTIRKYALLQPNDIICVAASGGKDSLTVLYLIKKYIEEWRFPATIFALAIDEGIHHYRSKTLADLELFCKDYEIPLHIMSTKQEFGATLDQAYPIINKGTKKKPCNICGVWRRYLINKHARTLGATKVVTGHNLDDEAQAIIMNIFKANTDLASHLGPISGVQEHALFIPRVKPLYFCAEKETRLYALLRGFTIEFTECPYSREGLRAQVQAMLNDFEAKYHGTKQSIVRSFLDLLPLLKEREQKKLVEPILACHECGEPAHHDVCNACLTRKSLVEQRL